MGKALAPLHDRKELSCIIVRLSLSVSAQGLKGDVHAMSKTALAPYNHKCPVQGCMSAMPLGAHMCDWHWGRLDADRRRRVERFRAKIFWAEREDCLEYLYEENPELYREQQWYDRLLQLLALRDLKRQQAPRGETYAL